MTSRMLSVFLCFLLVLPAGRAADSPSLPIPIGQTHDANAGIEQPAGSAAGQTAPPAGPGQQQTTALTEETAAGSEPASPQPLSREEEASLSARSEEPGPEVSGGALSNLHLTYIVIALAAIVLVLLIK